MKWEKNVWESLELTEFAKKLKSLQPYLDNWEVFDVDLLSDSVGLFNPDLPYRKRFRRKKLSAKEVEFFNKVSGKSHTL